MNTRLPRIISSADFPLAELCSARLDGQLFTLGECWYPIDEVEDETMRATSLASLVSAKAILERMTAAWVYGIIPEPRRHHVCVSAAARIHIKPTRRVQIREVSLATADTLQFDGVRVTTPVRTVVDLARSIPANCTEADHRHLLFVLTGLLRYSGHTNTDAVREQCERRSVPHRSLAVARLDEVDALLSSGQAGPTR